MVPLVTIIIPALNEENTIGSCLEKVQDGCVKAGIPYEVIIADSSSDRTAEIALSFGARIVRPEKRGYGNAYLSAFPHARGEIIVIGDADDTYDFSIIPELIAPILEGRADMVIGSRLKGTILPGSMPWLHQYIGNPVLTTVLNWTFHTHYSDVHSGMRAILRTSLEKLQLFTGGMEFASEMLIEAARKGFVITEIPINYYPRKTPSNLHSFADGWRHLRFIMLLRPLRFLMIPGIALIFSGILMMLYIGFTKNIEIQGLHSFILGALILLGGFQFLISGFVTKAYSVTHHYDEAGVWFQKMFKYRTLEYILLIGFFLIIGGILKGFTIFINWISSEGPLLEITSAIIALMVVIIGFKLVFMSLNVSMMLLQSEREGRASI